ncbi:MAG: GWxTD domain-containing protein [Gemmatimonadaceae bacterium]
MNSRSALFCLLTVGFLGAACPKPATTQPSRILLADSLAAEGDSAAALAVLDTVVRAEPRNAQAWHRRGMLAWKMVRGMRGLGFLMSPREIALRDIADSSLRLARFRAPDSARYALDLARHFLWNELPTLRIQAPGHVADALQAARSAGDSALLSDAQDEAGMVEWRRFEAVVDRRGIRQISLVTAEQFLSEYDALERFLEQHTYELKPPAGEASLAAAMDLFRAAVRTDPTNARARRHSYMALAQQAQWDILRSEAQTRIAGAPWDASAWLVLGLASHRLRAMDAASAAFDTALVLMPVRQRDRYEDVSRILRPADSASYADLPRGRRLVLDSVFWKTADPLMLTRANEIRNEFLSRITYAELRWSNDDLDLLGADTDRGQIWVRYGPPDIVASFSPADANDLPGFGLILWYYPRQSLHFVFKSPPTYGSASLSMAYMDYAERVRERSPALWRNLAIVRFDSIPTQASRFRGPGDSSDVVVYAQIPVSKLGRDIDLVSAPLDVAFILFDDRARILVRDSSRQSLGRQQVAEDGVQNRAWRYRLAPGLVGLRVEALQPDAEHAARFADTLRVSGYRGFGMSDVLVADRVIPRASEPERWTDMVITPSVGRVRRSSSFALLWETYALASTTTGHDYRVDISLSRADRSRIASAVAKVLGGTGGSAQVKARNSQAITLSFARQVSERAASLDYVTLDVSSVPAGRYDLEVRITDLVSGLTMSKTRRVRILE